MVQAQQSDPIHRLARLIRLSVVARKAQEEKDIPKLVDCLTEAMTLSVQSINERVDSLERQLDHLRKEVRGEDLLDAKEEAPSIDITWDTLKDILGRSAPS